MNIHSLIYLLFFLHEFISLLLRPLIYLFSRLTSLEIDEFTHSRKKIFHFICLLNHLWTWCLLFQRLIRSNLPKAALAEGWLIITTLVYFVGFLVGKGRRLFSFLRAILCIQGWFILTVILSPGHSVLKVTTTLQSAFKSGYCNFFITPLWFISIRP